MGPFATLKRNMKYGFEDDMNFTEWDCIQCLVFCISYIILCLLVVFQCLLSLVRHVITFHLLLAASASGWKLEMVPGKGASEKTNSCTSLCSCLHFFLGKNFSGLNGRSYIKNCLLLY